MKEGKENHLPDTAPLSQMEVGRQSLLLSRDVLAFDKI
jgi:hypothetical protein